MKTEKALNGAFRKRKVFFTQVSNEMLRDNTLSLKAKGLGALILSFITIPDFILYKNALKKYCKEAETSFESSWKELKDAGYLIQYKLKNKNGCFCYEYELLDEKIDKKEPEPLKNQDSIQTPKTGGVDNVGGGKGGIYNNTYPSNTYSLEEEEEASNEEREIIELFGEVKSDKITKFDKKVLKGLLQVYNIDIIKKAIEVFGRFSGKSIEYLRTTLTNWQDQGLKTPEEVEMKISKLQNNSKKASENRIKNIERLADKKVGSANSYGKTYIDGVKQDSFNSYKQREYNFDSLEKELLGWDK